jgi:hypothetical protein
MLCGGPCCTGNSHFEVGLAELLTCTVRKGVPGPWLVRMEAGLLLARAKMTDPGSVNGYRQGATKLKAEAPLPSAREGDI